MEKNEITVWLDFILQQIAAESYLDGFDLADRNEVVRRLRLGTNRISFTITNYTRLTQLQAEQFVDRFQIINQHSNDTSGFSATLLKNIDTNSPDFGMYTISFRSTEYQNQEEGGDWERDGAPNVFSLSPAGADGEIVALGFALGQLSAMEAYYAYLRDSGLLPNGAVLNVTGYSLGGHLATVFTELHKNDVAHAYTFNSPGRGGFEGVQAPEGVEAIRISQMLARLKEVMFDPDAGRTILANPENAGFAVMYQAAHQAQIFNPDWTPFEENSDQSVYLDPRYQWAKLVVTKEFHPDSRVDESNSIRIDDAFAKITQIVGHATHGDSEYVASSQYHPPETRVFIEDQPDLDGFAGIFGAAGDFGTTHSITLIVDSLALQELFQTLSPDLTQSQIEALIAASSAQKAHGFLGTEGTAEGDSLERALDALYEVFTGDSSVTPYSRVTGGFGDLENRTKYYERIEQVRDLAADVRGNIRIESLVERASNELVQIAFNPDPTSTTAIAYRYALSALNPFAVVGTTIAASNVIYARHNTNSELTLYDPVTRSGSISLQWIQDRAAMLVALDEACAKDAVKGEAQLSANTGGVIFNGYDGTGAFLAILPTGNPFGLRNLITFDNDQAHQIVGDMKDDHLYGGGGDDVISGADGVDWLDGGDDNDSLYGGKNGDWLFGGKGQDRLDGGSGANVLDGGAEFDTYVHDSSNGGFDYIRDDDGRILVDGIAATGGKRLDGNVYISSDRRTGYRLDGTTLVINGTIAVLDFENGDLGIALDDALDIEDDLANSTTDGVFSSLHNKYVVGSVGADIIAEAGVTLDYQFLLAGSGNDVLFVQPSEDSVVEGGSGADYIVGSDTNDFTLGGDFLAGQILSLPGNRYVINNYSWLDETPDFIELTIWDGFEPDSLDAHFDSLGYFGILDAARQVLGVDVTSDLSTFWNDVIEGRGGNDHLNGEMGSDRLFGQDGDDLIEDGGKTRIVGSSGFFFELTKLEAQASDADYLDGGSGNDVLRSLSGQDWMLGGEGSDFIAGGAIVDGGAGADVLWSRTVGGISYVGPSLSGEDGDDIIRAGNGAIVDGGAGEDTIIVGLSDIQNGGSVSIKDADGASLFILDTADSLNPSVPVTFARKASDLLVYFRPGNLQASVVIWDDWFLNPDSGADFTYVGGFYGVGGGHDATFWNFGDPMNTPFVPYYLVNLIAPRSILSRQQVEAATRILVEGTEVNDQVTGNDRAEMILGYEGDDSIDGASGDDVVDGGAGADNLSGGDGSDLMFGGDGNDYLDGGSGDDQMNGGKGDDVYVIDSSGDIVTELFDAGTDQVQSAVNYILPANVERLTLTGDVPINGTGNALDNVLLGSSAENTLDGKDGADILTGGLGHDTYKYGVGYGSDTIIEGGVAGEIDSIQFAGGLNSSDVALTVETGNLVVSVLQTGERLVITDWINPASRVELLVFADLTLDEAQLLSLFPQNSPPTVANSIADQNATEDVAFIFQIPADSFSDVDEDDTLSYGAALANGSALPSWLTFDAGTQIFSGTPVNANVGTISVKVEATDSASGAVSDVFDIAVANTNDAPTVANSIADQAATEDSALSFQVPENSFADVDAGDTLTYSATQSNGSTLPSWLTFNASTRSFSGTPLNANVGSIGVKVTVSDAEDASVSDEFILTVANTNDAPVVSNPITDQTVSAGSAFKLIVAADVFSDIDSGDMLSYVATLASGSALPSWLAFDPATRTFLGTPAAPDVGTLQVRVNATDLTGASVFDVFALTVEATAGRTIIGMSSGDRLYGTDFDDVIDGRAGADVMAGGRGNDAYYVDNIRDRVTELAGQGDDTIFSGVTYTLPDNVENIALIGAGNTLAFGNSLDNRLVGNNGKNALIGGGGNDTLDGKGGTDSMFGGAGDDTYYVDSALDSVTELANRGVDTVHSKVSYTLGAHVENLILIGSARIDGRGNAAANFLVGNTAINTLSGRAGNDILQGLDGNDVLSAAGGHTLFDGGGGADAITGGAGNEMFIGGIGNDTISTGAGADIIAFNVGDGRDLVTSGTGADNVLSIGGGIDYAALTFTKSGNNLIMKTAGADQITFKNWYSGPNNRSVARLQVFTEAMPGYDQNSSNPLLDDKVEQFNFTALANAFNAAGQVSGWALTNALLSAHLSGSDTEAIGGDLAYQYGKSGSLSGIGLAPAQDVINAAEFGSSAQALRTPPELQQGQIRLS